MQVTDMDPHLERTEALFEAVRRLSSRAERAGYLAAACGDDPVVRRQVEGMIENEAAAEDYFRAIESLGDSVREQAVETHAEDVEPPGEAPGAMVGRYRLIERIGEGGFGVVYLAEQREPVTRQVALKIIKPGMDTKQVVARFEAERQALALMDHPHIAKVLDGGTTGAAGAAGAKPGLANLKSQVFPGRPYFVMELVRGVPITEFCDTHRLAPQPRFELFIKVCQAVQHAHQKGIIHRDIKPSNVLVTLKDGLPHPMVIDFGVAKALNQRLTEKTLFTGFGQMIGTPTYMSPEQAEMSPTLTGDVDTRSDVYSLGVLLYELLTGTTPFPEQRLRGAGWAEMQRIIAEEDPPRPSTRLSALTVAERIITARHRMIDARKLTLLVRGELDWIVMKALEKDRTRRYDTVHGLAMDIQRFLRDEPVTAVAPSTVYRARKFVRRNKVMVTAAALVATALVLGISGSTWQAVRASRAEGKADMALENEAAQRQRAEAALGRSRDLLWQANFERARALRQSGTIGQQARALAAVRAAVAMRTSPELRTEAVAALALADLEDVGLWHPVPTNAIRKAVDGHCLRVAVATSDGQIEVRSLVDDKLEGRLTNLPTPIYWLWFNREGSRLAIECQNRSLVWDLPTQAVLLDEADARCLAISPDGRHVLRLVHQTEGMIWDLIEGREVARLPTSRPPYRGRFSPDGQRVVVASGLAVEVWNWKRGQMQAEFRLPAGSFGLAWRPDGAALAVGCEDHALYIWRRSETGLQRIACRGAGVKPFYHPGGELLVTVAHNDKLRLWDAETGTQWLESLIGYPLGFSLDGQWLAVRRSRSVGRLRVHPPEVCRRLSAGPGDDREFRDLAFSPDSRFLASGLPGQFVIWDAPTGRMLWRQPTPGQPSVMFSNPGLLLTTATEEVQAWTNLGSASAWSLSAPLKVIRSSGRIADGRLSSDQRHLVLTMNESGAVYDLPPISPLEFAAATNLATVGLRSPSFPLLEPRFRLLDQPMFSTAEFSPDARWIASGFWNNRLTFGSALCLWSAADGRLARRFSISRCTPHFSPDGRWFLTAAKSEYTLYECDGPPEGWREVWRRSCDGLAFAVGAAAFKRDGSSVAVLGDAQTIQLIAPATGREKARLTVPGFLVMSLAWSPDDRWLAVAMQTGTILWDLTLLRARLRELGLDWD
jgi:eukaryotic-like serine/threonine-protein kinase